MKKLFGTVFILFLLIWLAGCATSTPLMQAAKNQHCKKPD
jgi:predicted small lipoprotein YifL